MDPSESRFSREVHWLYQTALILFLVTIGLGMARGLGIIDFTDRDQLLTHLHSGTIGWITLGIAASTLWLYGSGVRQVGDRWVRWVSLVLIGSVPVYILAWWTGNRPFRAVAGAFVLLGIVLFVGWLVREAARIGYRNLTTPQLGAVVGLVTLVVGSTLGVLLQIQFASGGDFLPGGAIGAHAETQVSAYLVLVAMSFAYWRLRGNDRTRRGTWMVWLFFVGGAFIAVGILTNVNPLVTMYIPLDIAAFVIFLTLAWRKVVSPGWLRADSARHYAIAIPFALVYLAVFIYLIYGFLALWNQDINQVPPNLIPASEHPLFVGMVTNILFGLLFDLTRARREIWAWADHVIFWGVSLAVAAFTLAILFDVPDAFKFITPVLGISILIGIITYTMRLQAVGASAAAMPPAA
ncbi:MAG: hypothetical protein H0W81_02655 [Chloroflexi bacterium]|nr:hypothetical protein [Chloroflexota bacterium]